MYKTNDAQCSHSPPCEQYLARAQAAIAAPQQTPIAYTLSMMSYGTEYSF